jgi:Domain of unknown function (DUF4136)
MKQILILSSLALALLLSSCTSSLNTFADYDKNADLNKYKTYAWLSPGDSLDANPQNHQFELMYSKAITYASDENLKKKGMVLDSQNPDCLFKFSMGFEQKTSYSQSPTVSVGVAVGGPYYYGGVAVPVAGGNITEHRADEAFLYIQMFDTRTGALLWTGGARKMVDNAADSEKNLKLALNAIFSKLKIKHK